MKMARKSLLRRITLVLPLVALAAATVTMVAGANVAVTIIAVDPFTNSTSQHKTIVEPDTFSFGSTIVAAAQWGRFGVHEQRHLVDRPAASGHHGLLDPDGAVRTGQ